MPCTEYSTMGQCAHCVQHLGADAIYVIFQISFKNRGVGSIKKEQEKNIPAVEVSLIM
jgi:hypothetical protein